MGPINASAPGVEQFFMKDREFAARTGASVEWTRRAVADGTLRGYRDPGGRTYILREHAAMLELEAQYYEDRERAIRGSVSIQHTPTDSSGRPLGPAATALWFQRAMNRALGSQDLLTDDDRREEETLAEAAHREERQREGSGL